MFDHEKGIENDGIPVVESMERVLAKLENTEGIGTFEQLISEEGDRSETVATFLAVLELMKRKQIRCLQTKQLGDIRIYDYRL